LLITADQLTAIDAKHQNATTEGISHLSRNFRKLDIPLHFHSQSSKHKYVNPLLTLSKTNQPTTLSKEDIKISHTHFAGEQESLAS